jgi:hypothetical protein
VQNADADRIRVREHGSIFKVLLCQPMATTAAAVGNGDFGTSPFFGQLSDKLLLAFVSVSGSVEGKLQ